MTDLSEDEVPPLLAAVAERCLASNRGDLTEKVRLGAARASRPNAVVCVIGEYKQGKSSLLNALVGSDICPVHDDLATSAVTILYQADETRVQVRRSVNGEVVLEEIPLEELVEVATEQGDPQARTTIEHVAIGLPSPILEQGLVPVDTPGVGGLARSNRQTVLGFLPYADAAIFVTDASAELSAPEIEFLRSAGQACPNLFVALTKIDLYGEWRRIAELDDGHLQSAGIEAPVIPVSAAMSRAAQLGADESLDEESGMTALRQLVEREVVAGSRDRAAARALGEADEAVSVLIATLESESETLSDPAVAAQRLEELRTARQALKDLRVSGSRWSTVLHDGFTDLRSRVDFALRSGIRELLREVDEELGDTDPRSQWQEYIESLKVRVAELVEEVVSKLDQGAIEVAEAAARLLAEAAPDLAPRDSLDVETIWEAVQRDLDDQQGLVTTGLSALRGMQSGVILLGLVGQLIGLTLMLPVVVGGGSLLGAKQVLDERKRRLERRRHEARTLARQFLDQVQFETASRLQLATADLQRTLRDVFSGRVSEMEETCRQQLVAAERGVSEHIEGKDDRLGHLTDELNTLGELHQHITLSRQALTAATGT